MSFKFVRSLVALLVGMILASGVALWSSHRARVAPGLEYARLMSVQPGMSERELLATMGEPLRFVARGQLSADPEPLYFSWTYAEPGFFLFPGLAVYVLTSGGRVVSVNAKYEDLFIYSIPGSPHPPAGMPSLSELLE